MEKLVFNETLIQKYNIGAPRYTSYPTAALFRSIEISDYIEFVHESNAQVLPGPLSFYIHIPFCSTICYYCACTKIVTKDKSHAVKYVDHLVREFEIKASLYDKDREVVQLHFGGGTPTFLNNEQFSKIFASLNSHYHLSELDNRDFSIEIDPRTVNGFRLEALRQLGFNRLSFGVQDTNRIVQQAVNRIQANAKTEELVHAARGLGFKSINIDLIYGLPFQTVESFLETINRIIDLRPDRLSIFNYAHLPSRFKPQRRIDQKTLPSASQKFEIYHRAIRSLDEAGYRLIGMDHFALPEDDLCLAQDEKLLQRNFQGYSTHLDCDLVSFGISAISALDECYVQNVVDLQKYYDSLERGYLPLLQGIILTEDDRIRRAVIMQLMCHFHVSKNNIAQRFNIEFDSYFSSEILRLMQVQKDGLLLVDTKEITVTAIGRLMVRAICMIFDRYHVLTDDVRYSKII
ncbi:Coproporphyrinogen III oxidase, oxygen-independent [hydrothermal vent metagenome]|uniref:Oxygen-independent coproporphyrinogen III oxidase n=1 Tax=hydrothermal vent metagenome TaxID=652676 RepID=A0A3B0YM03_9ZZZZ